MLPWTCSVWNLISDIPSMASLEDSHAINIRPISMKFTRNTLNDPKFTHVKIILIQKDYHINFYMEQKRPLLLARSVYDMAIFYLLNNWTNRSNNIIHIWGLGMFIARQIKGCALLASLGSILKGNGSLAKYCEYTSSSYVPKITRWGHILHTSYLNSTQFHMFYIRGSRTLVIRVSHLNVHEAVRPVVGTGLLPACVIHVTTVRTRSSKTIA